MRMTRRPGNAGAYCAVGDGLCRLDFDAAAGSGIRSLTRALAELAFK
jgi:hypothetical protein